MKPNEIIREIMKLRGFSNQSLATKLGKSTASAISNPLSRENGMRIDTFFEMVDAMDCEIIVKSKLADKREWVVGNRQEKVDLDALLSSDDESNNKKIKLK